MPEPSLPDDFLDFLRALNEHAVQYLVIGGHAVAAFGAGSFGYTAQDYLSGNFIQFGVAPVRIDITSLFEGVPKERLWQEAVPGTLDGIPVRFPSKDCLLLNKKASGRPKDLRDIEALGAHEKPGESAG